MLPCSLSPGAPKSSKKIASKKPRPGSVACHVPSTTTTPGRSAAHARSLVSTGSAHSTMVCNLGRGGTARPTWHTAEAGTRTAYVQCVGPGGKLPCASGTQNAQEASRGGRVNSAGNRGCAACMRAAL